MLAAISAGVEHPIRSPGGPHRRLAQTVFVERAGCAQFEYGVRPEFLPHDTIAGARGTQSLPRSAILPEIEKIKGIAAPDHVGIGDAALIEAAAGTQRNHGRRLFCEYDPVA